MKNIILLIALLCITDIAFGAASWPDGSNLKTLSSIDSLKLSKTGQRYITGALNPVIVPTDGIAGDVYTSSSTGDMYIKQDSGVTVNWEPVLDGILDNFARLSTATTTSIVDGCDFNVSSVGTGNLTVDECVLRFTDSWTDPLNPTTEVVTIASQTVPVPSIALYDQSHVSINKAGVLAFTFAGVPAVSTMRDNIYLGALTHFGSTIDILLETVAVASADPLMILAEWSEIHGTSNYEGNLCTANGLGYDKTIGNIWRPGSNLKADKKNQSYRDVSACTACSFILTRTGATEYINLFNQTDMDYANYDSGGGTLTAVGINRYSIRYLYLAGTLQVLQYGRQRYGTYASAEAAMRDGEVDYVVNPAVAKSTLLGWFILRGNGSTAATDWVFFSNRPSTNNATSTSVSIGDPFQVIEVDDTTNPNIILQCDALILADASGGAVTVTLPDVEASVDECVNQMYLADNTNDLTITTVGGTQDIGSATTQTIDVQDQAITTVANFSRLKYLIKQDSRINPDLVTTDNTTIKENFIAVFDDAAKKIKVSLIEITPAGILKSLGIKGINSQPASWDYAHGNEIDNSGGSTSTSGDRGTFTSDASTTSYMYYPLVALPADQASNQIQSVTFNAIVSGTTEDSFRCSIWNNDTTPIRVSPERILDGGFKGEVTFVHTWDDSLSKHVRCYVQDALNGATLDTDYAFWSWDIPSSAVGMLFGENTFSARIDNNGTATITSQSSPDNPAIASVNRTGAGVVVVTFTDGHFTVPPSVNTTQNLSAGYFIETGSIATTGFTAYTFLHSGAAADKDFSLIVQRQGTDYIDSSPIAGTISSTKVDKSVFQYTEYDLATSTVTAANWTSTEVRARPYKDNDDNWRMTFNVAGSFSTTSGAVGVIMTFNGATFASNQSISVYDQDLDIRTSDQMSKARVTGGGSTFLLRKSSTFDDSNIWLFSGDVALSSEPTFTEAETINIPVYAPTAVIYPTETKILSADATGNADIAEFTYTDLVVGVEYHVTGQMRTDTNAGAGNLVGIRVYSGAGSTGTQYAEIYSTTQVAVSKSDARQIAFKFTATDTGLYFRSALDTGGAVRGNGTKSETYIQLTRGIGTGHIAEAKENIYKYAKKKDGTERIIGEWFGDTLYQKCYEWTGAATSDATVGNIGSGNLAKSIDGVASLGGTSLFEIGFSDAGGTLGAYAAINGDIHVTTTTYTTTASDVCAEYTKP
jgi:hypothetical protein